MHQLRGERAPNTGVEWAIRRLFVASFTAVLVLLVLVAALKGTDWGDTFEIAVIYVVRLTLGAAGPARCHGVQARVRSLGAAARPHHEVGLPRIPVLRRGSDEWAARLDSGGGPRRCL